MSAFRLIDGAKQNVLSKRIVESIFNQKDFIHLEWDCKDSWLTSMNNIQLFGLQSEEMKIVKFTNCSRLHASMIQDLFPNNVEFALEANKIYPNDKEILFWIYKSAESNYELKEMVINQVVSNDPTDANGWTALGKIYVDTKNYESALHAFKISCEIDDRKANGCYYVGSTYRLIGDTEKAIDYFRLSYWPRSGEIADQLEAELSTQNP